MKLALHRSITFWSGLLVMGFVCWAWWDSEWRETTARAGRYRADSAWSGLSIQCYSPGKPALFAPAPEFDRGPIAAGWDRPPENFPLPIFVRQAVVSDAERQELLERKLNARQRAGALGLTRTEFYRFELSALRETDWFLHLPYWLLLLACLLPWTAFLIWRARRRRAVTVADQA